MSFSIANGRGWSEGLMRESGKANVQTVEWQEQKVAAVFFYKRGNLWGTGIYTKNEVYEFNQ